MNSKLTFEYRFSTDGDDFGLLFASVETPRFTGTNEMWVQWQDLTDFAATLARFPIAEDDPATWNGALANRDNIPP